MIAFILPFLIASDVGKLLYKDYTICGGCTVYVFLDTCGVLRGANVNADSFAGHDSSYYLVDSLTWANDTLSLWENGTAIKVCIQHVDSATYADTASFAESIIYPEYLWEYDTDDNIMPSICVISGQLFVLDRQLNIMPSTGDVFDFFWELDGDGNPMPKE